MTTDNASPASSQYPDSNDRDIQAKQDESPASSDATSEVDDGTTDVQVLPGTGGPDDVGEVEVDTSEIRLPGFSGADKGDPTEDAAG